MKKLARGKNKYSIRRLSVKRARGQLCKQHRRDYSSLLSFSLFSIVKSTLPYETRNALNRSDSMV